MHCCLLQPWEMCCILIVLNLPYRFNEPAGLSLAAGALWIANTNAHEIVRVDLGSGQIKRLTISD